MKGEHFFIAGAQRSGTTYLYHLCSEHPQIEMAQPVMPEPKFFITDDLFEQGMEFYKKEYFKWKPGANVFGEKGTSYIEFEKAAQRISQCFPTAKIIFSLRNPIERAISNYFFSVKNGLESLSIEQAFLQEESRYRYYDSHRISASPFAYLKRGRYADYIEMYERYFPTSQLHIMIFEGLLASAQPLHDLYAFLGVDTSFVPPSRNTIINAGDNKSGFAPSPALLNYLKAYFAESNQLLFDRLGHSIPEWEIS